ncbi:MAG: glycosyltransferase [Candidatus Thiodiazotropha sp. (ex Monitilora ramsayi)]|nr:glycosyltransferase [Candidatus Thiodiazotropha sp. (ex Monitilora ramsayi)]
MTNISEQHPLVSIIIPAFNGARYLRASIESILHQDYPKIELIVLDDGSTDETHRILEHFGDQFFWESHQNMGQSATLNKGWQSAKGEILAYLSVDDILNPTAVTQAVLTLQAHPETPVVYGNYDLIDQDGESIRRVRAPGFSYQRLIAEIEVQPGPGAFFRREVFEQTGGWDPSLRQTPDFDFWLKAGILGDFVHIDKTLAKFRVHSESQTHAEASPEKADECVRVIENFYSLPDLPSRITQLKSRALATAHTVSTRSHIRSGRFGSALKHLLKAIQKDPGILISRQAWKMVLSGIRYRLNKAGKGL